jgi:hypothetical protein
MSRAHRHDSGRPKRAKYPQDGPPEYMRAWGAYNDLWDQLQAEHRKADQLQRDKAQAVDADRQALADAIRAGKNEPTETAVKRVEAAIAKCERQIDALNIALDDAAEQLDATVAQVRDQWATDLSATMMDARTRVAEAIDEIEVALGVIHDARTATYWVLNYQPGKPMKPVHPAPLALPAPSGDDYTTGLVLAALRRLVDQPDPQRIPDLPAPTPHPAPVNDDGSVNTRHGDYVERSRRWGT